MGKVKMVRFEIKCRDYELEATFESTIESEVSGRVISVHVEEFAEHQGRYLDTTVAKYCVFYEETDDE